MQYRTSYPYATTSQHNDVQFHTRDEQRRRQQEYFQALSQQVAHREEQKRLEREHSGHNARRNEVFPQRQETFEPAGRSLFDGLGQNNPQKARKSFARGQLEPQKHLSIENSVHYPQVDPDPPRATIEVQSGYGQPSQKHAFLDYQSEALDHLKHMQPFHHQPEVMCKDFLSGPNGFESNVHSVAQPRMDPIRTEAGLPALPVGYPGYRSSLQKVPVQISHDKLLNAPVASRQTTFQGDLQEVERLRRKVQQQHEMQLALERQIEEKRQQKLEAKRKQDEEDRLELKRFEDEQQRLREERERVENEKRRKAELEQQKAEQAAAAVAAASLQAKVQQQEKLHAQFGQVQQECRQSNEIYLKSGENSCTNSRANLFERDHKQQSPHRDTVVVNTYDSYNQNAPTRDINHESNGRNGDLSSTELRRQYDDMREELRRQKQLVDQLRQAQAQIQQHQKQQLPECVDSENAPTLRDFEILRNDLREELAYREQLHRQEIDALKREQQQELASVDSHGQLQGMKKSVELPTCTQMLQDENAQSLRGDSTFVYLNTEEKDQRAVDQEDRKASDVQKELIQVETLLPHPVLPQRSNERVEELYRKGVSFDGARRDERQGADTESEDETVEFFVTGIGSSPLYQQSSSLSSANSRTASSHRYSHIPLACLGSSSKDHDKWRLKSIGTNNASDSDDDLEETFDGDQLDALFQRNVRRHEILVGFQNTVNRHLHDSECQKESEGSFSKKAWTGWQQQIDKNQRAVTDFSSLQDRNEKQKVENALLTSSKWIPSS